MGCLLVGRRPQAFVLPVDVLTGGGVPDWTSRGHEARVSAKEPVNWPGYRLTTCEPGQRFVTVMTAVGSAGVGEFGEVSAGGGEAGTALDGAGHGDAGSRCFTSGHRQRGLSDAGGLLAGRVQVEMPCVPSARANRSSTTVWSWWPPLTVSHRFSSNQPSSQSSTQQNRTGVKPLEPLRGGQRGRRHAGGIDRGRWRRRW